MVKSMKGLLFILFPVLLLCSCAKEQNVELVSFTYSGCADSSPSAAAPSTRSEDTHSLLILKYTSEGFVITRTNAIMNCSINNDGIGCNVSLDGDTIHLSAHEKGDPLRCVCPVETMTYTLSGLQTGKAYILDYSCDENFLPISFSYIKDMTIVIDLDLFRP